jgi:hypothetical protein
MEIALMEDTVRIQPVAPNTLNGKASEGAMTKERKVVDFGYLPCGELSDLITIWLEYAGDGEMWQEVWRHRQTCRRCAANRRAIEAWKEYQHAMLDL